MIMRSYVRYFYRFSRPLVVGLVLNLDLVLTFWYLTFEDNFRFHKWDRFI